jgi:hypothetical protein
MLGRVFSLWLTLLLLTLAVTAGVGQASDAKGSALAILRGRVFCVDASGRELNPLFDCSGDASKFTLKTSDGKRFAFLAGDGQVSVFSDSRVRQRDLQITANRYPDDRLEVIKVQSVKDGKLYDLYYFCELCNITAFGPGPCPCCRNDLEFRETLP